MSLNEWTAEKVAKALSGNGKQRARKTSRGWKIVCPAHNDKTPSLSLADGNKDVLLYHCFAGCSQKEVKSALERALSITNAIKPTVIERQKTKRKIVDNYDVICPVPIENQNTQLKDFYHFEYGFPVQVWTYRLPGNRVANWIARYNLEDGNKEIIPWSWTFNKLNGRSELKMKGLTNKRPLYNLDKIMENPNAPIIWTEGEKSADAAEKLFPKWISTTTQGGTNALRMTDLRPLHGKTLIILPDYDRAGNKAGAEIVELLYNKSNLKYLNWPTEKPNGDIYVIKNQYDAADHLENGWTNQLLKEISKNGKKIIYNIKEIAPSFDVIHYDWEKEKKFK